MNQEKFFQKNKKKITVAFAIVIFLVGLFLRTYNFHDWLDIGDDQVNDAVIVGNVVNHNAPWPLLGPKMSNSGTGGIKGKRGQFSLGPMFYYFEIISAKLFGNYPDKLAYPDWLFDVLALPLFYLFLKRFFNTNLTLALTGLYAVSFYALSFSRSAWNPDPIPFFILLFLLSTLEFLVNKEKTKWMWVVLLGIALGVGIQLHAILLVLLSLVTAIVFFFLMKKNWRVWKKWGVVFLLVLILNTGQIMSEFKTNFQNSKIFLNSIYSSSGQKNTDTGSENGSLLKNIPLNISCHVQANAYMLSSAGDNECNFSFTDQTLLGQVSLRSWAYLLISILFSVFGYGILIYNFRKEKEEKRKYFLGLIILFVSCSFLVMLPVVNHAYRYFVHTIFVPFLFLGFLFDYLARKNFKIFMPFMVLIFSLILATNFISIQSVAKQLLAHARNGQDQIVLGETETMVNYIIANSKNGQREAYVLTSPESANFFRPLQFIAGENQFRILRTMSMDKITLGKPLFYIRSVALGKGENIGKVIAYRKFGQVDLYQLGN